MPVKPETRLQNKIQKFIREWCEGRGLRCWGFKVHGGPMQKRGIPDLIYCVEGIMLGLEVKLPGGGATKLQAAVIEKMGDGGALVGVVWDTEEVERYLRICV